MISSRTLSNIKKDFFPNFLKKVVLYMYIFSVFSCSLWNEPTMKIYFLSHSHTWTPLLRVHFGHARVPFGHALGHQQSSILKICKSIMPFLKKKKLNKKSSRYTKFDKKKQQTKNRNSSKSRPFRDWL